MGLLTIIQIPCHHVLANEITLNLKYRISLKQFFNINLGIGIIKKFIFFVHIFDIYSCIFTQISIEIVECGIKFIITFFRYFLFLGQWGLSKVCRVGTRWMHNLILHPASSPDRNLIKNIGRYVENMKKVVFYFIPPKLINIILLF